MLFHTEEDRMRECEGVSEKKKLQCKIGWHLTDCCDGRVSVVTKSGQKDVVLQCSQCSTMCLQVLS